MLPHEILARRKKCPIAFIGLGTIEWHSEHLAVGLDALKADQLCDMAAQQSGGFAFPPLWYGEPRVTRIMEDDDHDIDGKVKARMGFKKKKFKGDYFAKTGEQQIAFYKQLLRHMLIQMDTLEMKAVCFQCGHGPMAEWAGEVVEQFNKENKHIQAFAGDCIHYVKKSDPVGKDHAAKWETSYMWYLRPDCIDMSVYLGKDDEKLVGIIGTDPRGIASRAIGKKACDLVVTGMVKKAQQLLKRATR